MNKLFSVSAFWLLTPWAAFAHSPAAEPAGEPAAPAKTPALVCPADAGWDDPSVPHKIYGNTYFVGTCGITSILITSPEGHVLIDGGTAVGGELILANVRALGFDPKDVRAVLLSHEHWDHAGGLAILQQASGATVYAMPAAAAVLASGKSDRSDPQFEVTEPMTPIPAAALQKLTDGQQLKVGSLELTAHATPGHTPGGTSWTWKSCEGRLCYAMAYVDSLTAISDDVFLYTDEASHPGYLAAFRKTLEKIAALPCDILLTPHPAASQMWPRLASPKAQPLIDAKGCANYAARGSKGLDDRVAREKAAKTSP